MSQAAHKIKCNCPKCRAEFNLSAGFRGKRVKCYVCGAHFTVPLDTPRNDSSAPQAEPMPVPININMPPIVRTHSHGLAAVLSLLIPGVGHAYCGHFGRALLVMCALVAICVLAVFCFTTWYLSPLGLAAIVLFALAMAYDAYYLEPKLPSSR